MKMAFFIGPNISITYLLILAEVLPVCLNTFPSRRMAFLTVTINTNAFLNFVSQLNYSFKLINFKMNQKKTKYSGNRRSTATHLNSDSTGGQRISPGVGEYAPYEDYGSIRSIQEIGLLMILFVSILMLGILFYRLEGRKQIEILMLRQRLKTIAIIFIIFLLLVWLST